MTDIKQFITLSVNAAKWHKMNTWLGMTRWNGDELGIVQETKYLVMYGITHKPETVLENLMHKIICNIKKQTKWPNLDQKTRPSVNLKKKKKKKKSHQVDFIISMN